MTKRIEAVPATAGEAAKAPASASKGGGLAGQSGTDQNPVIHLYIRAAVDQVRAGQVREVPIPRQVPDG